VDDTDFFGALARLGAGVVFVLLLRKKSYKILFKSGGKAQK
jgi:hypothetical protein